MFYRRQVVWSPNELFVSPIPQKAEPSDLAVVLGKRAGGENDWYQLLLKGEVVELPESLINRSAHVVSGSF